MSSWFQLEIQLIKLKRPNAIEKILLQSTRKIVLKNTHTLLMLFEQEMTYIFALKRFLQTQIYLFLPFFVKRPNRQKTFLGHQ